MTPIAAAWYPVALSDDIEPGTSNGTRLFGREIVVWRDSDGGAHVWEDRCPHRGMRLSLGFIRGDRIACLYHGWRYDAEGRCRLIPAHPQLTPPDTIRVPVLASAERLGMIWARSEGAPDAGPLPDEAVTPVRSITIACAPERALAQIDDATRIPLAGTGAERTSHDAPSLLAFGDGGDRYVVGLQPLAGDACVLHIVLPGDNDRDVRKRASAWAEALRRKLELPSQPKAGPP